MGRPTIPYTIDQLPGLRFRIDDVARIGAGIKKENNKTYAIHSIVHGECNVMWDNETPFVQYAVHCVLEYLNSGVWFEVGKVKK